MFGRNTGELKASWKRLLKAATWAVALCPGGALAAELTVTPDSLDTVLDEATMGDVLILESGSYGAMALDDRQDLVIEAREAGGAEFEQITVRNSTAVTLRGLVVAGESVSYLIELGGNNDGVTVEDCFLESAEDTSDWSAQDWIDRASGGISVSGTNTIRGRWGPAK